MSNRAAANRPGGLDILQSEKRVLAGLFWSAEPGVRERARELLTRYAWRDAAHRALFEIMTSFGADHPESLREQLPARLTRRGFPDFDFDSLFEGPPSDLRDLEKWIRGLSGAVD